MKPIFAEAGHQIGVLRGTLFRKSVHSSRHLFKAIGEKGSWGLDYDVLHNQLPKMGAVEIYDAETNVAYRCTNEMFREKGIIKHFKKDSADHYTQVFLPLEYFDVIRY